MKSVRIFLLLLLALTVPTLATAQKDKGHLPQMTEFPKNKVLPFSRNPDLNVEFIVDQQPIQEPPLLQWRLGVKVTDAEGKNLAGGLGGSLYWHRPYIQDVITVHEEPVILLGDSSRVDALHYSSGYLSGVGDWMGGRVEFQLLDDGDYRVVVSASDPEGVPNVFRWNGSTSREDTQGRATLLKRVVREAGDEVENSPDIQPPANLGNQHRWIMDCFRALNAAVILGDRADALHICSRARERIEKSQPEWICGNTQPDCNARSRRLELDQLDSGVKARTMAAVSSPD